MLGRGSGERVARTGASGGGQCPSGRTPAWFCGPLFNGAHQQQIRSVRRPAQECREPSSVGPSSPEIPKKPRSSHANCPVSPACTPRAIWGSSVELTIFGGKLHGLHPTWGVRRSGGASFIRPGHVVINVCVLAELLTLRNSYRGFKDSMSAGEVGDEGGDELMTRRAPALTAGAHANMKEWQYRSCGKTLSSGPWLRLSDAPDGSCSGGPRQRWKQDPRLSGSDSAQRDAQNDHRQTNGKNIRV